MISYHVAGVIAAAAVIPIALQAFDRTPGVHITERAPLSAMADPGGYLLVRYQSTRGKGCEIRFHRAIIDAVGQKFPLATETVGAPAEDETVQDVAYIPVPLAARSGVAVYEVSFESRCNPAQQLRPVRGTLQPIEFVIAEGKRDGR